MKILVVDDSELVHSLIRKAAEGTDIEIAGEAYNGKDGLEKCLELKPDIVVLDVEMPIMNGLEATESIMETYPLPIIIFTSAAKRIADLSFQALEAGAVDIVHKPATENPQEILDYIKNELFRKIRVFENFHVIRRISGSLIAGLERSRERLENKAHRKNRAEDCQKSFLACEKPIVGIASSTGGPQTLKNILSAITDPLSYPVIILQHIPIGFFASFKNWLQTYLSIPVKFAENGEMPSPGVVYIADEGKHLGFRSDGSFRFIDSEPVLSIRPCADILFHSMAEIYGKRAIAVELTGMGEDGKSGCASVKKAGGKVIAQDEAGCILFGMPKSVIQAGLADKVLYLYDIPKYLKKLSDEYLVPERQ